ncbi:MAG: glucose/mannose-6-phosphate isomerase [Sphingobacteriales bacterium]|jgi:glucose/mannose-6-phosphate isomerase
MRELVEGFNDQLKEAMAIANGFSIESTGNKFANVVISGVGGSGIGGKIVSEIIGDEVTIPVVCNHHYWIPNFVDENTLFIVCSYSGNTEETKEALSRAMERKAHIVCVTSGGIIGGIAEENNFPIIKIPGGQPPRSALGFSLVQLLRIFEVYELVGAKTGLIEAVVNLLQKEANEIKSQAKIIAKSLEGKMPILYSDANSSGVAVRWRQQLNENAKILCWHHSLPEMNHNELVGWVGAEKNAAVIVLKLESDHPRTKLRMGITKDIICKYCDTYIELEAKGQNAVERAMYLINIGDWVSVYLADIRQVDPVEVNVIDFLKESLAKVNNN